MRKPHLCQWLGIRLPFLFKKEPCIMRGSFFYSLVFCSFLLIFIVFEKRDKGYEFCGVA